MPLPPELYDECVPAACDVVGDIAAWCAYGASDAAAEDGARWAAVQQGQQGADQTQQQSAQDHATDLQQGAQDHAASESQADRDVAAQGAQQQPEPEAA